MKLLVAEDDPVLQDSIHRTLTHAGYLVDLSGDGEEAWHRLCVDDYALLLLDLGLPGQDGLTLLRRLRKQHPHLPVLIVSARGHLQDRITGLDLGADDYLAKPFELTELEARVRALLRRSHQLGQQMRFGDVVFDANRRQVLHEQQPLELSARELAVFEALVYHAGHVVTKTQLLNAICSLHESLGDNAIEVYLHRIRKKLEPLGVSIRTVRGIGYLLDRPDV